MTSRRAAEARARAQAQAPAPARQPPAPGPEVAAAVPAAVPAVARGRWAIGATLTIVALIVLTVAWECWLAPLRPGGTALVLKAVPLVCALPGVWRRKLYTLQWASMLVLLYMAEGIVRGMTDGGMSARLGWVEVALATLFLGSALAYVAPFKRASRAARRKADADAAG